MPGQNLPVLGDGAHLIKTRDSIALGPAHTFSAENSSLHVGAAAGAASLLSPALHASHTHRVGHSVSTDAAGRAGRTLKACRSC